MIKEYKSRKQSGRGREEKCSTKNSEESKQAEYLMDTQDHMWKAQLGHKRMENETQVQGTFLFVFPFSHITGMKPGHTHQEWQD